MIKVKDWNELQHFKDRSPPWIKLYKTILERRDIAMISDRNFRVLIGIWLLASEDKNKEGTLPEIQEIAFRLRKTEKEISEALEALKSFLIFDDINMISNEYQLDSLETETEAKKRQRQSKEEEKELAVKFYNETAKRISIPRMQKLTATRKKHLAARLEDCGGLDGWKAALEKLEKCPFLYGENDRGWKADFDFLITESKFIKLMEGKYDKSTKGNKYDTRSKSQRADDAVREAVAELIEECGYGENEGNSYSG